MSERPDLTVVVPAFNEAGTIEAVIERLRHMPGIRLDEHVVNSALIYDEHGRAVRADWEPEVAGQVQGDRPVRGRHHPRLPVPEHAARGA